MTMMRLFLFGTLFISLSVFVNSQGEQCVTPNQNPGLCTPLPQCLSLVKLYESDRSRNVINFLVASQKNCGNRNVGRNPLLCCRDGVQATTTTTTPAPPPPQQQGVSCETPDGFYGSCTTIKGCPSVLQTFIARQKDPAYIKFIQQSNANCNYVQPQICCPENAPEQPPPQVVTEAPFVPPPQPPPQEQSQGGVGTSRLMTPAEGCGVSTVPHNRVVGGVPAKKGGWPWMALVGYKNSLGEVSFKCGGSIVTSRHVLTAAHCVRKDLSSVRVGEHDLSIDTEANHIDVAVARVIAHPAYDKKDGHSDLTILVLDGVIPFSTSVTPVCMPLENPVRTKSFVGFTPFVAGWGRTQEGGKSANILQELQLPVIKTSDCENLYNKIGKRISDKQFDDAVMCAGFIEGGKDSCQGDSGGPLMIPQQFNGQFIYYQIGVVSYGIGCARAEVPGVYTKVQTFVDWIRDTVEST